MAFLEVEKKYDLLDEDLQIIDKNFNFISDKVVKDIYYDTEDFYLCKHNIWLRDRDGKLQLKYPCTDNLADINCYHEYYDDEAKQKLQTIIWTNKLIKLAEVTTHRKKYKTTWEWYDFTIDVDDFEFGKLVEIEISGEGSLDTLKEKIEAFRDFWRLNGPETREWKWLLMLKYQRPELYDYWKNIW